MDVYIPNEVSISFCYLPDDFSLSLFFFFFFFICLFRAAPLAYEGSQGRGQIGVVTASLHHSHSNGGSETCLRPTLQLMVTLDL